MPFPEESDVDAVRAELLENAIRFLELAGNDLVGRTPVAIVHFAIGIELLLKWRLAMEHWLLLIDDLNKEARKSPEKVWAKFSEGDVFTLRATVLPNYVAAATTLSKECRDELSKCFKARNRVVHFRQTDSHHQQSVALQCRAWFLLNPFLADWGVEAGQIESIERTMRRNREYLRARFEHNTPHDSFATRCPVCRFVSLSTSSKTPALQHGICWTCDYKATIAVFPCGMTAEYVNNLEVACKYCVDSVHDRCELLELVEDDETEVYCDECRGPCVVIRTRTAVDAMCPDCEAGLQGFSSCEFCGVNTTGIREEFPGCGLCLAMRQDFYDDA